MTCFPTSTVASVLPKSLISLTRRSTRRPLDGGNGPLHPLKTLASTVLDSSPSTLPIPPRDLGSRTLWSRDWVSSGHPFLAGHFSRKACWAGGRRILLKERGNDMGQARRQQSRTGLAHLPDVRPGRLGASEVFLLSPSRRAAPRGGAVAEMDQAGRHMVIDLAREGVGLRGAGELAVRLNQALWRLPATSHPKAGPSMTSQWRNGAKRRGNLHHEHASKRANLQRRADRPHRCGRSARGRQVPAPRVRRAGERREPGRSVVQSMRVLDTVEDPARRRA